MDNLNKSGEKVAEVDDTNPITLLKNPEKFRESFFQLADTASQSLKAQEWDKSLKALSKCLDMLDLGKNILKDISKYWKLCIYANLACVYQGTWKMQKCNKFCEKVQEQLEQLLQTADCKENFLNITKHIIRIKFQHCAILSQLNQHERALKMCQSTLPSLEDYIRSILEYAESLTTNQNDKKSSETVHFSRHVCSFAEQILNNLLKSLSQPLTLSIDKSSFYYWQKNPQNNEEQVKKKFVSGKSSDNCKRSILGVNKMAHWIDEFNIGTIMHMSELSIKDFEQTLPIQEYIFKDKLYETVIHCSVAHFTIATEMRFIESNKQREKQEGAESGDAVVAPTSGPNINSIRKKYGYEEKSEMFRMSELYHLRAINIMADNIKTTVPYISHLIKSYDKHYIYKKQLEPVIAIAEESLISVSEANIIKSQNRRHEPEQEEDHYYAYNAHKANNPTGLMTLDHPNLQINHQETNQILDDLSDDIQHDKASADDVLARQDQQFDHVNNFAPMITQSRQLSHNKKLQRNKSMGKLKTRPNGTKTKHQQVKGKKKVQKGQKRQKGEKAEKGEKGEKGGKKKEEIERELRIKHQSCTQIKVVLKKKK